MNTVFSNTWLDQKHFKESLDRGQIINPITASKILTSVSKIVNIVNGNNRYQVIFKGQEESGYIDYSKKQIVISTSFLKDPGEYSIYDIVDLETGLALHESGHAEYSFSKDVIDEMKKFSQLEHYVYNILEDAIMEKIVSNEYPGYEGYFIKLRKHYFKKNKIRKTKDVLSDRINELLIGLRYPGDTIIYDDKVKEVLIIVNDLLKLSNEKLKKVNRVELAKKVLNMLLEPEDTSDNNEKTKDDINNGPENDTIQQNNQLTPSEHDGKARTNQQDINGELKDFLNQMKKENSSSLSNEEINLLNSILEEEYLEEEYDTPYSKFEVTTCNPKIFKSDKDKYNKSKKRIKKHIIKFRNKFSDANTLYRQNAYGLQSGILDEDNLYSAKYNRNIFMNTLISNQSRTKNIDIAFTIDCSGSMNIGLDHSITRMNAARDLCTLFVEALEPINSINTWVFGFKNSMDYICDKSRKENTYINCYDFSDDERNRLLKSTHLIKAYSPTNKNKFGIGTLTAGGLTPEYEALTKTVDILLKESKKDSKKIIVMLTDGEPGSDTFSYYNEISLIKDKLKECKRNNITVIHLALTSDAEKTPYTNKIQWDMNGKYDSLIEAFLKTLKKEIQ